jgi:DNA-binding MarR family transcriptional regulator
MEDSVKLSDTQLRLLAAASQRGDRALERPSNLTGGAAGKVVAKLLAEGLIEKMQSRGSSPVWRRDGDDAHTLRITGRGLWAIRSIA